MTREKLATHQKAFRLNMDSNTYGTVAEIGAGQEVARWFFQVGGAAGTIAKSMSAYDMTVSDAIYGASTRYVSRDRLLTMLEFEFGMLSRRLAEKRGPESQLFAFANTVTARSYVRRDDETHGWMGLRFQHAPGADSSDVILHVRMLDAENVQQQEALGILGVNLIYGSFTYYSQIGELVSSLLDGLSMDRIEVNLMRCSGPAFPDLEARLLSLELVSRHLTEATMFRADGEVVDASEILYKRPLLIARGSFRPVTRTMMEIVATARKRFLQEPDVNEEDLVVMAEMTLASLRVGEEVRHEDFLDRVDTLQAVGMDVLITNAYRDFRLASYLFQHTKRKVAAVMGAPDSARALSREVLRGSGRGDPRGLRSAVQERPPRLCLSDYRSGDRRAVDGGEDGRRAAASSPARLSRRQSLHRGARHFRQEEHVDVPQVRAREDTRRHTRLGGERPS